MRLFQKLQIKQCVKAKEKCIEYSKAGNDQAKQASKKTAELMVKASALAFDHDTQGRLIIAGNRLKDLYSPNVSGHCQRGPRRSVPTMRTN